MGKRTAENGEIMNCRSCGKEVIWVRTNTGKTMPVDSKPSPDGNVLLIRDLFGQVESCEVVKKGSKDELHLSHFATCPQARKWRKR
jgi:hypothetical protein